ncbi:type II toxin-antitoxin system VapB family antitoxin [Mesorhizobium sp. M0923]|uniref:type II toxin-antitoxin system VapB family antitoxin n=1 Tax=Mesorhizobium sp. M0923 TaxID=2957028 RepID=UPI00333790CB
MAVHIKNPETDALARRVAALKRTGLTEAVPTAPKHELEREQARSRPSLVEIGVRFCRDLRARGKPDHSRPADKAGHGPDCIMFKNLKCGGLASDG